MTEPAEFIDRTLRAEGSELRAVADAERLGVGLGFYGASVGAVRGTVRDADRRYPGMSHDEVTALAAELWSVPVYERRLAAIVLLQRSLAVLRGSDLTRVEQFLRDARVPSSSTHSRSTLSVHCSNGWRIQMRRAHDGSSIGGRSRTSRTCAVPPSCSERE